MSTVMAAETRNCIPMNDSLTKIVGPTIDTVTGALGGALSTAVVLALVVATGASILTLLSKKSAAWMKVIAFIAGSPILVITIIALYYGVFTLLNTTACNPGA